MYGKSVIRNDSDIQVVVVNNFHQILILKLFKHCTKFNLFQRFNYKILKFLSFYSIIILILLHI